MTTANHDFTQDVNPDLYPSVAALMEDICDTYPERPAFRCFGTDLTYAQLEQRSRAVAAWLQQKLGVKRGDRIALMCPNIFAFPVAMYGIIRAGAAQVNVNPLYTAPEMRHQLNDSGAEVMIVFSGSTDVLAEIVAETSIKTVITINLGDGGDLDIPSPPVDPRLEGSIPMSQLLSEGAELELEPVPLDGDDILYFQYTGGTTGPSKGAVLTHRNLVANAQQYAACAIHGEKDVAETAVLALPLYHIFGLMLSIAYMPTGSVGLLIPNPRDMGAFMDTLKANPPTVMAGVNTLFAGMMAHPKFTEVDWSGLKIAVGGGAPVLRATSEKWRELTGNHIKIGYGLSETSPLVTITPFYETEFRPGKPAPATEIVLLDDDGNRAAEGEAGEICVRGPQVMRGYWNKPDANEAAFTEDGFFRTGDIGVINDNGEVEIVDRKKDLVLVSGFNVYPVEIEAVVSHCPGVLECACIGVPHEKTGEALRVFVVRESGSDVSADAIIDHCRSALTNYKLPRDIRFVDELPKSNVGKILRRELRRMVKEGEL